MMIRIAKAPWRLTLQDSHGKRFAASKASGAARRSAAQMRPFGAVYGCRTSTVGNVSTAWKGPLLPTAIARPQYNSSPAPLLPPRASELTLTLDGFLWQVRRTNQDTVLFLCCGRKAGILKEHTLETVEGDLPLWAGLLAVMQFMDSEGEPPLV